MLKRVLLLISVVLSLTANAAKTDIVILKNGDRITGEVKELNQGKLKYSTDDIGIIYVEWDNISQLYSINNFEVVTGNGFKYFGSIGWSTPGKLKIISPAGTEELYVHDVVIISPIKTGFWNKIDGNVSLGFSYTRASNVLQTNSSLNLKHQNEKSTNNLTYSNILTYKETERDATKQDAIYSFSQLLNKKFYWLIGLSWQQNSELGILSRASISGQYGKYVFITNVNSLTAGAGALVNQETSNENVTNQNIEALISLRYNHFSFDRPKLSVSAHYFLFPSLTINGRVRQDFDTEISWKVISDFKLSLRVYFTTDNKPVSSTASNLDWGIITSIGYTF
ncbi:MAG: DUF481 domain-containing protein [Schleiferiaceae bacterium]|nr:DUF481 domain-containing protein [Schleiferiaceae bacterium]